MSPLPSPITSSSVSAFPAGRSAVLDSSLSADEVRKADRAGPGPGRALAHAARRQILRILLQGDRPMSAVEISGDAMAPCSAPCTTVHVQVLADAGLLLKTASAKQRGSIQHSFSVAPLADWIRRYLDELEESDLAASTRPGRSNKTAGATPSAHGLAAFGPTREP